MTNEDAIKWLGNLKNDIGNPHYECLWPYAQAIDEIIELLKEREAVEPVLQGSGGWLRTIDLWYCGACHARISKRSSKFCQTCGRKVKWE